MVWMEETVFLEYLARREEEEILWMELEVCLVNLATQGYPIQDSWGRLDYLDSPADKDKKVKEVSQEVFLCRV